MARVIGGVAPIKQRRQENLKKADGETVESIFGEEKVLTKEDIAYNKVLEAIQSGNYDSLSHVDIAKFTLRLYHVHHGGKLLGYHYINSPKQIKNMEVAFSKKEIVQIVVNMITDPNILKAKLHDFSGVPSMALLKNQWICETFLAGRNHHGGQYE